MKMKQLTPEEFTSMIGDAHEISHELMKLTADRLEEVVKQPLGDVTAQMAIMNYAVNVMLNLCEDADFAVRIEYVRKLIIGYVERLKPENIIHYNDDNAKTV